MLIDSHAHLAPNEEALNALLASMDRLGIDRTVVVGGGLVPPSQISANISQVSSERVSEAPRIRFDNLEMQRLAARAEGRVLPFYFANPWIAPDEYIATGRSFYGLKLGPAVHGSALNSEETRRYLSVAESHDHPVYLHCLNRDGFRVGNLTTLAQLFPSLTFILGHGGIGNLDYAAVAEIEPHSNIFYETSGAFKAVVKHACTQLGAKRVLFGSEYPLQSAIAELAKINDLDLSPEDVRLVTSENVSRLLERRLA
jgi:predicted TIM-barrel fold metal-dependent hydrolase